MTTAPRLLSSVLYEGPNLHCDRPAIKFGVEFGTLGEVTLGALPGLAAFLVQRLAADPAIETAGWFALPLPEIAARLAAALQQHAGYRTTCAFALPGPQPGRADIILGYRTALIAHAAGEAAIFWLAAGLGANGASTPSLAAFRDAVAPWQLGQSTELIVATAERRGIPWFRVHPTMPLVQLGEGCRQQRFQRMMTGATSRIAYEVASRKDVAAALMRSVGLPAPAHRVVNNVEAAVAAARALGYPVVVKPVSTDKGVGVRVGIADEAGVRSAFAIARRHGRVLIEQQLPGRDYRLVVIHGRMVAAARRTPGQVVGDGHSTVRALIDRVNEDPHRIDGDGDLLVKLVIDDEMHHWLERQGIGLETVPPLGHVVRLRGAANISSGGTSEDVTAEVHPVNRLAAERAARIIGLDLAGIDFIIPDIRQPYHLAGGGICEVNPIPGLRPHLGAPGSPDLVETLLEAMFPGGDDGRIPTAAITGTNGKTTVCRMVAAMLRAAGHIVGLAITDGVMIGETALLHEDLAGAAGAKMVLRDPAVTAAVLETARGGIIKYGLGFDRCRVGAVLNIGSDHLGMDGIATAADLARAKGLVIRVATELAVLNADDPLCRDLASSSGARRLCWVACREPDAALAAHIVSGAPAVTLGSRAAGAEIHLWREGDPIPVVAIPEIPASFGGAAKVNVANALFAVAIGHGLGLAPAVMAGALRRFAADPAHSPGRLNFHEGWPFQVLLDHADNAVALVALRDFVASLPVAGKRRILLNTAGNRRHEHFDEVAAAVAGAFDAYLCTTGLPRGRAPGEVSERLAAGLRQAGVDPSMIEQCEPEETAFAQAFRDARPGDLLVILAFDAERAGERLALMRPR